MSDLRTLIDNHKAALDRSNEKTGALWQRRGELDAAEPIMVPISVRPDGSTPARMEMGVISPDEMRRQIRQHHSALLERHCSEAVRALNPQAVEALRASIVICEQEALEALAEKEAEYAQRIRHHGVDIAQDEAEEAMAEETKARLELVLYRPKDKREQAEKAAYIEASAVFADGLCEEPDFVGALIERMSECA